MKTIMRSIPALLLTLFAANTIHAQGTVFTYQGRLLDSGQPANGTNYGMNFYLYDSQVSGNLLGVTNLPTVTVSNGIFTTPLSFASTFDGGPRWLEIGVQKDDSNFTILAPRQQITPAPYAIFANTASNLTGNVSAAQLPASAAQLANNQTFTGSNGFTGTLAATKWNVSAPINDSHGPLPVSGGFNSSGGTLMITVSGSAYTGTAGTDVGVSLLVDGSSLGIAYVYANSANFHIPFVSKTFIKKGLASGAHTVQLNSLGASVVTDYQDVFEVTVQELPF